MINFKAFGFQRFQMGTDDEFLPPRDMNDASFALAEGLIASSYIRQAQQARRTRESMVKSLIAQRRLPKEGWDEGVYRRLPVSPMRCRGATTFRRYGLNDEEWRALLPLKDTKSCKDEIDQVARLPTSVFMGKTSSTVD